MAGGGQHPGCWNHGQVPQEVHRHQHQHQHHHRPMPLPLGPTFCSSPSAPSDVDEACLALLAELLSKDSQAQQHSPSTAASSEDQLSLQELQDILRQCVAETDHGSQAAQRRGSQGVGQPAPGRNAVNGSCCPEPMHSGRATPASGMHARCCDHVPLCKLAWSLCCNAQVRVLVRAECVC